MFGDYSKLIKEIPIKPIFWYIPFNGSNNGKHESVNFGHIFSTYKNYRMPYEKGLQLDWNSGKSYAQQMEEERKGKNFDKEYNYKKEKQSNQRKSA